MKKTLLAVALIAAGCLAAPIVSAQSGNQVRAIEQEYARLHDGRLIPDDQLEYYLDRSYSGWSMERIRQDMAGYRTNTWRPQSGWIAREVVCSSIDNRYRECRVPFRGTPVITAQISQTACIPGRSWGTKPGVVWVDRGCRARFGIVVNRAGNDSRTVVCKSDRNRYRECNTGFRGDVRLVTRLQNSASCIEGRSWGQRPGVVWVRNGCRAQFESVGRPGPRDDNRGGGWVRDNNYAVSCESMDGRRAMCTWDSRYGSPRMIQQISSSACIEGRNWGYDSRGGLWVDSGCRARFGFR